MDQNEQYIISHLQQISDVLLINGGFLSNQGLYSGETGLVLFFARYARYTQNELYLDYCFDLIEKIQSRIHKETLVNYRQGLAGIGSAIEYLVQNSYFEADTDDILEEFDKRIFFTYNLPYLTIDEIIDVSYYANWRLSGNSVLKDAISKTVLPQIEKVFYDHSVNVARLQPGKKTTPSGFEQKTSVHCLELISKDDFWNKEPGLQNGLAGWGLSLLTELDGDDSWFSLLPNDFKQFET